MRPQHHIAVALKKLKLPFIQHKILFLMLLGSILLHTLLVSEFSIHLPELMDDQQSLSMRLVEPEHKSIPIPAPAKHTKATPKPKPHQTKKAPEPAPAAKAADITGEAANIAGDNAAAASSPKPTEPEPADESLPSAASEDNTTQEKTAAYSHVEAEFDVMRGINTPAAGLTKVVFNVNKDGRYSIVCSTQAKGLASIFLGNLVQKSEGSVTADGLRPDFYSYQYGNDQRKSQSADFEWEEGILHMHSSKGDSTAPLSAGTQDLLSFMYQFMYTPPLDTMHITMTNGKRLRTYTYSFEGEETIITKLGALKTIHLLKGSGDEEKTEVWLASDYRYLPVRIRKTEKDGTIIEQLITSIKTDTN